MSEHGQEDPAFSGRRYVPHAQFQIMRAVVSYALARLRVLSFATVTKPSPGFLESSDMFAKFPNGLPLSDRPLLVVWFNAHS